MHALQRMTEHSLNIVMLNHPLLFKWLKEWFLLLLFNFRFVSLDVKTLDKDLKKNCDCLRVKLRLKPKYQEIEKNLADITEINTEQTQVKMGQIAAKVLVICRLTF